MKQKHAAQTAREDRITVNLKTTRGSTFTQTLCRLLTYSSRYSLDRQKCHIFEFKNCQSCHFWLYLYLIFDSTCSPTIVFQSRTYVQTGPSEVSQMAPYAIIFNLRYLNQFVGLQVEPKIKYK